MLDRPVGLAGVTAAAAVFAGAAFAQTAQSSDASRSSSERECLARAMYFESQKSAEDGMLAVGTVVANRMKSGRYGGSMCSVVAQRGQFAAGVMTRSMTGEAAERARRVAEAVLKGNRHPAAKNAMFFHTAGLKFRYPNMHYVLVSGGNAFYEKRNASSSMAANANAQSMGRAYAAALADKAAAAPVLTAALKAAGNVRVAAAFSQPQPLLGYAAAYRADASSGKTQPNNALAVVASLEPRAVPKPPVRPQQPRVISPAAPVQAAMGPVAPVKAVPTFELASIEVRSPVANLVVAQAWSAFN